MMTRIAFEDLRRGDVVYHEYPSTSKWAIMIMLSTELNEERWIVVKGSDETCVVDTSDRRSYTFRGIPVPLHERPPVLFRGIPIVSEDGDFWLRGATRMA